MTAGSASAAGPEPLRIFLVAGEESGDKLGGALMRALAERTGGRVRFSGVGGADMAAQGIASLFAIDDIGIIGFTTIPLRLPRILARIRQTATAAIAERPHALVIIDSPEFTHRVARRVRAMAPSIPIIDYVSPSVWAWRPGRARAMRAYVDHVLALLPFEPAVHARLGGPPCTYVGHPLTEQATLLRPSAEEAQRRNADPPRVLVLPGSRAGEARRHIDIFGAAVALVGARCAPLDVVLPTLPHLDATIAAATAAWPTRPRIVTGAPDIRAEFRTARAALAASGTVTLELAIAGVPSVVAYKVSLIEEIVGKALIRVPSIVLANLMLGEKVMPELLQRVATPERLAAALALLIAQTPERSRQLAAFAQLDAIMGIGDISPSARAAEIVMAAVDATRTPP